MTMVYEVADALNKSNIDNLGHAYPYMIPASSLVKQKNSKAILAVSEVQESPTEHGSNAYTMMDQQVQIKICYPIGNQVNMDTFEKSIVSFFMQKNWLRQPDNGHYIDPSGHVEVDLFFKRRI